MIKKEYIQPEVKEVKILLPTILADSTESIGSGTVDEDEDIASLDLDFEED